MDDWKFDPKNQESKGGISSIELGRRLDVTQTTAWKIKHKLMQVMMERDAAKRLTGRIEVSKSNKLRGSEWRARRYFFVLRHGLPHGANSSDVLYSGLAP